MYMRSLSVRKTNRKGKTEIKLCRKTITNEVQKLLEQDGREVIFSSVILPSCEYAFDWYVNTVAIFCGGNLHWLRVGEFFSAICI